MFDVMTEYPGYEQVLWKWKAEGKTGLEVHPFPHSNEKHIAWIRANVDDPETFFQQLTGPNGYALYQALLAQKGKS